jgi:hypothetical protein
MQALQLSDDNNGNLNQGYHENDNNWAGFGDRYP